MRCLMLYVWWMLHPISQFAQQTAGKAGLMQCRSVVSDVVHVVGIASDLRQNLFHIHAAELSHLDGHHQRQAWVRQRDPFTLKHTKPG